MSFYKWSKVAATNASADPAVNWAEGMAPSAVNDSARAEMASNAKWRDDISGTITTTGSSTAYAITTNQVFASAALMSGAMITFIPHATNGASPTLAVDGLTARAINKSTGVAVATGQLIIGTPYVVSYIHATTEFVLQGYTEVFGNVTVNGTALLTGIATFTAAPVFNGGASLNTGTYSGAATFSGNLVLSGLPNYTNVTKAFGVAGGTTGQRSGSPTTGDIRYNTTLNGLEYWNGTVWVVLGQQPTVQSFVSGTAQTYTAATGVVRQRVRIWGPGGGGGAVVTNAGVNGSADTSFQVNATGTAWTAVKGSGGAAAAGAGGVGGTGGTDGSTGTLIKRVVGARGQDGMGSAASAANGLGGQGGSSPFGGAGAGRNSAAGTNAAANTGSGGGGAGGGSAQNGGAGGGSGEYVEFWVTGMTTATYTIGLGGAGGTAGTNAGGNGAAGGATVEEFYS